MRQGNRINSGDANVSMAPRGQAEATSSAAPAPCQPCQVTGHDERNGWTSLTDAQSSQHGPVWLSQSSEGWLLISSMSPGSSSTAYRGKDINR